MINPPHFFAEFKLYRVYAYINDLNKKIYIGQTEFSLEQRAKRCGVGYKESTYFYRAIKKHGWCNFTAIILSDGLTKSEADIQEQSFIKQFQSTNKELGYNLRDGGSRGKHSEQSKLLVSSANKGRRHSSEHNKRISVSLRGNTCHTGKPHSDETKATLSKCFKGKTWKLIDGKRVWLDKPTLNNK